MFTTRKTTTVAMATTLLLALGAPATAQDPLAVEGTFAGKHWIDEEAPGCAPGSSWSFHSEGAGELADIGEVSYILSWCSVFDPETLLTTYGDGSITFSTADGDTLETSQVGVAGAIADAEGELTGFTIGGVWQAVGGSGRFADAAGQGWLGSTGAIPDDAEFTIDGSIVVAGA